MISTVGRTATILALCLSIGLHWFALQSVAWATMLVDNARHEPLSAAVARTFDGSHPCDLCHVVAEGKKSDKKSDIFPTVAKLDLICIARTMPCRPPSAPYEHATFFYSIPERSLAPPAPPPRLFLS